jgi:hypothetical protein
MYWFEIVAIVFLGIAGFFMLACFVDLVVLRSCYACGTRGAKQYAYMHSDGASITMQYCDKCVPPDKDKT